MNFSNLKKYFYLLFVLYVSQILPCMPPRVGWVLKDLKLQGEGIRYVVIINDIYL